MLMESAWLAAAAILPLFFNYSSIQAFEPDKMFVLKALVLVSGAAWLLREIVKNEWDLRRQIPSLLRKPLVTPILSLAAIYLLSTLFSVAPVLSWWGAYYEAQGTIAFFCYLVLFLIVLSELHSSAQLKRLQYVFILTSIPVSGYAILQHFGLDPFPWEAPFGGRSGGSMGSPVFLGGYLVMVIPLTICRIINGWKGLRNGGDKGPGFVARRLFGYRYSAAIAGALLRPKPGATAGIGWCGVSVPVYIFGVEQGTQTKRAGISCRGRRIRLSCPIPGGGWYSCYFKIFSGTCVAVPSSGFCSGCCVLLVYLAFAVDKRLVMVDLAGTTPGADCRFCHLSGSI